MGEEWWTVRMTVEWVGSEMGSDEEVGQQSGVECEMECEVITLTAGCGMVG